VAKISQLRRENDRLRRERDILKKGRDLLGSAEMRFRLIEDHRGAWPVRVMCDALSVSPSRFSAWLSQPESPRKIAERELLVDTRRVHARHQGRYGATRIHVELRAAGQSVTAFPLRPRPD
jgi:hypothetical protein